MQDEQQRSWQKTNEEWRWRNGKTPLLRLTNAFTFFIFLSTVDPLRRWPTMITTTMTTMSTRPLLHIAQKGCFKNFKYEKQRETLEFFFLCTYLIHSRFHSQCTAEMHYPLAWSLYSSQLMLLVPLVCSLLLHSQRHNTTLANRWQALHSLPPTGTCSLSIVSIIQSIKV
jgi:hypothetical protein